MTLVIAPPLWMQMKGHEVLPLLGLQLIKEIVLGYLFGFLFSLLIEAAAFAGQMIGVMSGLTATELISLSDASEHPLMARLFSLLAFTLFLMMDFHHALIRMLFESFQIIPLNFNLFSFEMLNGMIEATARLFHQALSYAFFPLLILALILVLLSLASRFLPNLFWVIFPIQSLAGVASLILASAFFIPILEKAFYEFAALARKLLFPL